jgi:hypothetical protein
MLKLRTLASLAAILVACFTATGSARAATTLVSAQVNGGSSTIVQPGATITVTLTVTITAGSRWRTSGYRISTTPPGGFTCRNTPDHSVNGTFTESFTVTAPATPGTYDAYFTVYTGTGCGGTQSNTITLTGGVVVDNTPPTVSSIVRAGGSPTGASSVSWTVTFSEIVNGVNSTDFALVPGGAVGGAAITSVTGGGTTWTVTAGTGTGDGTLGLNLVDNDTILDQAGNPLGGVGAGNGSFTGQVYSIVKVASFNAVEPGANAATGKIFTKIAGQDFALDIIALDASNAVSTTFTGTVTVEVVDASGGGACNALPVIATFTNQTFAAGDAGRHALTAGNAVGNVYRNALIRVKYPTASPTVVSCSIDGFAVRPASLAFAVTDANRTTEGVTNTLNNTALAGALVHNAGRPFRITATAYAADGTTVTTNYDPTSYGGPTALSLAACAGTACTATFGTLGLGAWSASGGVATTTTASYDEVGAFSLQLQDAGFAAVDSTDGSSYIVPSAAANVGRFVPDRFVLSAASITPRSDLAGCAGSAFTYMSEKMSASFTLTAVNAAGNTTALYAGGLGRLALTGAASFNFGAIDAAAPTPLTGRIDTTMTPAVLPTWVAGVATVAWPIALQRAAAPDGPYSALKIGIAPSDPDTVTLAAATLDLDADNDSVAERAQIGAAAQARFGRLRVLGGSGSSNLRLPIRLRAEYWDGNVFAANSLDSCTPLGWSQVAMSFSGLGACATAFTTNAITVASGSASWLLSAPGAAGAVDLRVNLNGTGGTACVPASSSPAASAALPYLQGRWTTAAGAYTDDPVARGTFGTYGQDRLPNSVIFRRENF